jgi:hypothetical protein
VRELRELLQLEDGRLLVVAVAVVEGNGQSFELDLRRRPGRSTREVDDLPPPAVRLAVELEPVRADVHDSVDRDAFADVVARSAADDGNEWIAADESRKLHPSLRWRVGVLGTRDDRREHAVEVEEDRGFLRRRSHVLEQRVGCRGHARSIGRCVLS